MLESKLESVCVAEVHYRGGMHRKLDTGFQSKGQLDHAFWLPNGRHFIVEFKVGRNVPTKQQTLKIARLKDLGHEVYVIDNLDDFKSVLNGEKQ